MVKYVLSGVSKALTFELNPGLNRFGRNPTNDLRISDPTVSSFHCEVTVADDRVRVHDLCSTNGTFVDRVRVEEAVLLPGQVLQLGDFAFRLEAEEVRIAIPELPVEAAPEPAVLADGSPGCFVHRTVPALHRCTKCGQTYCEECVRTVGLSGSRSLRFCPQCSGPCEPVPTPKAGKGRKQSLLGRLTQTIRIHLR